jgi:autotransporter-associated beta strand protein
MSNGQLTTDGEGIGGVIGCSFQQTGGTNTANGNGLAVGQSGGGSATYTLGPGTCRLSAVTESIAPFSQYGTFTQNSGNNTVSSALTLANGSVTATYTMYGGTLSAGGATEYIGCNALGDFTQYAGTHTVGSVVLGENSGSTGNYVLAGGSETVGSLLLGQNSGSWGEFYLYGGLLRINSGLTQGGGNALFEIAGGMGGGTLQAGSDLSTSVPMFLATEESGSNCVFDTNGHSLTLAGPLSGPGGLQVIGFGSLTLAVSNGYTGTTLVSAGTLLLGDPNALFASTFDTSGAGSLSFGTLTTAFFGGLQGTGNLTLSNTDALDVALSVGGNNANTTFSGNLSDLNRGGSLTKTGSGLLVLTGDNSYGGGTDVEAGTLIVASNTALPAGTSLTVGAGGTFIFDLSAAGGPASGGPSAVSHGAAAVPEPGTLALLSVVGIVAATAWRRRKAS